MSIIRSPRTHNFTILDNTGPNDPRLSWGGVGLLTYLLTKQDNWQVSVAHLTKFRALGRDGVYKLLAELEECGYIKKSRAKAEQGRFSKFEYVVYDRPQGDTKPPLTDIPEMDSPLPGLPDTVKPTLVNTDKKVSTEGVCTPLPPKNHEPKQSGFDRFWKSYPKKKSKGQAEKAWAKIRPSEQLVETMLESIERAKTSWDWQKEGGQFIPYPASWLNAKGWQDEIEESPAGATTSTPGRAQPQQHKGRTHENYSRPRNRAERCESDWQRNVEALNRSLAEEAEAELDRRTVDEASCDLRGEVVRLLPRRHG